MNETPTLNEDLVRDIADAARAFPRLFDMGQFGTAECGTARCMAGWACNIAAPLYYRLYTDGWCDQNNGDNAWNDDHYTPEEQAEIKARWLRDGGRSVADIEHVAADLLGIDAVDADWLFFSNGPKEGLKVHEALEKWAAGSPLDEVWQRGDYTLADHRAAIEYRGGLD